MVVSWAEMISIEGAEELEELVVLVELTRVVFSG
jgi:hypothetical protein